VLFRLGRMVGTRGPGLVLIIPVVDRPFLVDLREQYLEIPRQTAITEDNATIAIDFISTKFVVPMKLASLLQGVVGSAGRSFTAHGDGERR
jgi:regulator of protease activity HflC (stomatin/prohibitin superfamily)